MRLSKKSDYALRALICLAEKDEQKPVSVRDLAETNEIPRKYLESIMGELRSNEIVESIAGKRGGYKLTKQPREISIGDIIRIFDGSLISLEDEENQAKIDENAMTFRVQRMLQHIGSELDQLLKTTTLQHILDDDPIHYLITNRDEFAFGDGI